MWLAMVVGAALFIVGYIAGWLTVKFRPANAMIQPRTPKAVCGCSHSLAFHKPDKDGGGTVCHATEDVEVKWDSYGEPYKWEQQQCPCQQYIGPRSIDTYIAPEITDNG